MTIAVSASAPLYPGSRSASELITAVLDYVSATMDDPQLKARALRGLNFGIDRLNGHLWNKVVGSQTIPLVDGTSGYSLDADVNKPYHCSLLDTSYNPRRQLAFLESKTFEVYYPDATSGSPEAYTMKYETRQLIMNIAPSTSLISQYPYMYLQYHRRIPHMSSASALPQVPSEFEEFLVWYGREEIAATRVTQKYMMARAARLEAWKALRVEDAKTSPDWNDSLLVPTGLEL